MARKVAKKPAARPETAISKDVEAKVLARMEAEAPAGAQQGLFGGKGVENLKKIVKEIAPAVVKAGLLAGMDGAVTPDEVVSIVADVVRRILALSASPGTQEPEGV
jgi:hypothetical protein